MRYYCEHCKTEYKFAEREEGAITYDPDEMCPICGNQDPDYDLIPIPNYETPEQYEQRTGNTWPDYGLVWYRQISVKMRTCTSSPWLPNFYCLIKETAEHSGLITQIVVSVPSVPPPDDWRPQ